MERNESFLIKAEALKPKLRTRTVSADAGDAHLKKGGRLCIDFGEHLVGYLSLDLSYSGSHPDAPAWIKLRFAERKQEFEEDTDGYDGWISTSWIQQEQVHVDVLPSRLDLRRR